MALEEKDLTPKQREWLALSQKIGPGAMTRTERESLEKVYKEMVPQEQQELYDYIMAKAGKDKDSKDAPPGDPIMAMAGKSWSTPSEALKKAFGGAQKPRPKPGDES